jgi:malate synthase
VAHPDLVPVCTEIFDKILADRPNQLDRRRDDVRVSADQLLDVSSVPGAPSAAGLRTNIDVGLRYLEAWLGGNGAVGIHNLMEDAATAEISRSQLWQWRTHAVQLDDEAPMTAERYATIRDEELATLRSSLPDYPWTDAAALLDDLVLADDFVEFLTLAAYSRLA